MRWMPLGSHARQPNLSKSRRICLMPKKPVVIALDGPAASGKGTLAARLAAHYDLPHLDTGLLYRAVGHAWMPSRDEPDAERRAIGIARHLDPSELDAEGLTSAEVGQAASIVSAIPEVRAALLDFQHRFASNPKGAILDGRDIGTVICPDADVKLFVTATPETRAARRASQLRAKGQVIDDAEMLADIKARDERDMNRASAPLVMAADAHLLDTTEMDIEAAFRAAVALVDAAMTGKDEPL
jgi:cytidylate kinase